MKLFLYLGLLGLGALLLPAQGADLSTLPEPLKTIVQNYLLIQDKLAQDQFEGINAAALAIQSAQPAFKSPPFPPGWPATVTAMVKAQDIHSARLADQKLSADLIAALAMAKSHTGALHVAHCPMVKADWIQSNGTSIQNPYFGQAMLTCGAFTTVY